MDADTEARLLRRVHDMEERQLNMSRDIDMLNLTMTRLLVFVGSTHGYKGEGSIKALEQLARDMEQLIKG